MKNLEKKHSIDQKNERFSALCIYVVIVVIFFIAGVFCVMLGNLHSNSAEPIQLKKENV